MRYSLTFLFDGGCPLCLRETNFLKSRNSNNQIKFVDINDKNYNPTFFNNITYSEAMSNLHGILENGEVIRGIDVLAYAYNLIGMGWVYFPVKIKFISPAIKLVYRYWAKNRLRITGRSNIQKLCNSECQN